MKYNFIIHKAEEGGFWTECIEKENYRTQADTFKELISNIKEVVYLMEDKEIKDPIKIPFYNEKKEVMMILEYWPDEMPEDYDAIIYKVVEEFIVKNQLVTIVIDTSLPKSV